MKLLAEFVPPDFVATLGDNFYGAGVGSVEDRQWDYKYEQVYLKNNSSIRSTRWFASLGDHDHCGNVQSQIVIIRQKTICGISTCQNAILSQRVQNRR